MNITKTRITILCLLAVTNIAQAALVFKTQPNSPVPSYTWTFGFDAAGAQSVSSDMDVISGGLINGSPNDTATIVGTGASDWSATGANTAITEGTFGSYVEGRTAANLDALNGGDFGVTNDTIGVSGEAVILTFSGISLSPDSALSFESLGWNLGNASRLADIYFYDSDTNTVTVLPARATSNPVTGIDDYFPGGIANGDLIVITHNTGSYRIGELTVDLFTPPDVVLSAGGLSEVAPGETLYIDVRFDQVVSGLTSGAFNVTNADVVGLTGSGDTYVLELVVTGSTDAIITASLPGNVTTPARAASPPLYLAIVEKYPSPQSTLGYRNAALLGHSYFFPTAFAFEPMAQFCGYRNQINTWVERNPGATGAPGAVWDEYTDDAGNIIDTGLVSHIKQGGVELLGMTYFYNIDPNNVEEALSAIDDPEGFALIEIPRIIQDYRNWIDLALDYNEDSLRKVFVMTPWVPDLSRLSNDPFQQFTINLLLAGYGGTKAATQGLQNSSTATVQGVVQQLRLEYPSLEIIVIPAGDGLMALWDRIGSLPDITSVSGPYESAIYGDRLHGGHIVYELNHLLWMTCLFPELDIRSFNYLDKAKFQGVFDGGNTGIGENFTKWRGIDLRQLAWELALAEPYSGLTNASSQINHAPVGEWRNDSAVQEGAEFASGISAVTARFDAWDPDGATSEVEVLFGDDPVTVSTVARTDVNQPYYEATWNGTAPGVTRVRARITDDSAPPAESNLDAYISMPDSADMEGWQHSYFDADLDGSLSILERRVAARSNDANRNGRTNEEAYYFGENPITGEGRIYDFAFLQASGTSFPSLTYTRRKAAPAVSYALMTSSDLLTWREATRSDGSIDPDTYTVVSMIDNGTDGTETITLRYNEAADDGSFFMQVQASE